MGNEKNGINNMIDNMCDSFISIKQNNIEFPYNLVDSLNVSVSNGIILQKI